MIQYSDELKAAVEFYDRRWPKLQKVYNLKGQGALRDESGRLFEELVDMLVGRMGEGLISKPGILDTLHVTYEHPDGTVYAGDTLQVDRHIWKNGKRHAFVEAKTYLDSPYLKRAVSDLLEIKRTLDLAGEPTTQLKYIVFAGQNAIKDSTRKMLEARFWQESSLLEANRVQLTIVFVNKGKRTSSKPLYKNKYALDFDELERFIAALR